MPVTDRLPVWPDERAIPWRVVPVASADVLWDTLCQNQLFDFDQEGLGLLHKAHFALTAPHAADQLVVVGAWWAVDQDDRPIGVSVVSRWLPKEGFLKDIWLTSTDVFVLKAHRAHGIGRALASAAQREIPWSLAFHTPSSEKIYRELGLVDGYLVDELLEKGGCPSLDEDYPLTGSLEHQGILLWWRDRYAKTRAERLNVDKLCVKLLENAYAAAGQAVTAA